MNEELVEKIESNPKYKELLAAKIGDGVTTIAFPIALAILVISFITTLIYVNKANGEFENLTNEIKKDVKDMM